MVFGGFFEDFHKISVQVNKHSVEICVFVLGFEFLGAGRLKVSLERGLPVSLKQDFAVFVKFFDPFIERGV